LFDFCQHTCLFRIEWSCEQYENEQSLQYFQVGPQGVMQDVIKLS
jgi:hypothetical protein